MSLHFRFRLSKILNDVTTIPTLSRNFRLFLIGYIDFSAELMSALFKVEFCVFDSY